MVYVLRTAVERGSWSAWSPGVFARRSCVSMSYPTWQRESSAVTYSEQKYVARQPLDRGDEVISQLSLKLVVQQSNLTKLEKWPFSLFFILLKEVA